MNFRMYIFSKSGEIFKRKGYNKYIDQWCYPDENEDDPILKLPISSITLDDGILNRIYGPFKEERCEHDPIDVGFNRTKMICKKCNEDL